MLQEALAGVFSTGNQRKHRTGLQTAEPRALPSAAILDGISRARNDRLRSQRGA